MNRKPLRRKDPENPVIRDYDNAVRQGRKSYHVVPHSDGWAVKQSGMKIDSSIYQTKDRAVNAAQSIAKHNQSELFIHGRDGHIRERKSYAKDPFTSQG